MASLGNGFKLSANREKLLLDLNNAYEGDFHMLDFYFESAHVFPDKIEVNLTKPYGGEKGRVFIFFLGKELVLECSCCKSNAPTCLVTSVGAGILLDNHKDMMDWLSPEFWQKCYDQHSDRYLLQFQLNFDLFFKAVMAIFTEDEGLRLMFKEEYSWLINSVEDTPKSEHEIVNQLLLEDSNDERKLAFLFSYRQGFMKMTVEIGKPQKKDPLKLVQSKSVNLTQALQLSARDNHRYDDVLKLIALFMKGDSYYGMDNHIEIVLENDRTKVGEKKIVELLNLLEKQSRVFLNHLSTYSTSYKDYQSIKIYNDQLVLKSSLKKKGKELFEFKGWFETQDHEIIDISRGKLLTDSCFLIDDKLLYLDKSKYFDQAILMFKNGTVEISHDLMQRFLFSVYPKFGGTMELDEHAQKYMKTKEIEFEKKQVFLSELDQFILIKPVVTYSENYQFNPLENTATQIKEDNFFVEIKRDQEKEKEFVDELEALHSKFSNQKNLGFFNLNADEFVKGYWFLHFSDKLKELDIEIFGEKELKKFKYSLNNPSMNVRVESGIDWFDTTIDIKVGDETISLKDLKKSIVKNENFIKLSDGKMALLPEEWFDKMKRYFRIGELTKEGTLQISKQKFNALDDLEEEGVLSPEILKEINEKKQKLKDFDKLKNVALPKGVEAKLRDYQREGYNWLCFLEEYNWGGILADDMGLGKTLQALTFIQRKVNKSPKKKVLVIVPTSLLFNWQEECAKFCPSINIYLHYGSNRGSVKDNAKDANLILTSYGVLINEIEELKKITFSLIVLDESQAIKNTESLRYKSALQLKADQRITLSGTPIENNTFELYAQLNFVNKGLLGTASQFKTDFSTPIDTKRDEEASKALQQIVSPFVLRRTKSVVAKELPDKTESVIYCELEGEQRKVYDAYRNEMRNSLVKKIEEEGLEKNSLLFLQALTKLRQICDSPSLLPDHNYTGSSAKVDILIDHIKEKTGKHKVLVFSQFVKMLELIGSRLQEESIRYTYLDGQLNQKQRQEAVEDFQTNDETRVFLISLKAGGTGLNLTEADYVYIVDPWWNPAVENQAIDRCYRIGQTKNVMAYRMICKDTIEEKIMALKSKKSEVSDSIISTDESVMKKLSKETIAQMFD